MSDKLTLPLISAAPPPRWNGFQPLEDAEVWTPQGAYNPAEPEAPLSVPLTPTASGSTELLAPAGGLDAGFAAFHFGADAIYLGLKKFSARAEAENFTIEEVDEITAYAHSLTPRRRVFVTINTLIRQDELAELIDALADIEAIGVDAVILQDLGVLHAIQKYFPKLALHGSTQMAVHNGAGAKALQKLGFERVVLARELTFEEVRDITAAAGIETEVFIHGALCYAYSGLCLFSAQTLGRSGNRGKCSYSCRESFEVVGAPMELRDGSPVHRDPTNGFPFSMKDLALPDHLPALRSAGVSCFKIEGRKKSPLYVATTTDYYRRLLDGTLDDADRPDIEADLQTVFSRPWTRLFIQSHKDKEVADRDTVGHRGAPIGKVLRFENGKLRFRTARPIERHDGLQIDLPILGKPFGFPIDHLWLVEGKKTREVFEAAEGALVEVGVPPGHPELPAGAPVYCSSSQDVKKKYRHARPKPGAFHTRAPMTVDARLTAEALTVVAQVDGVQMTQVLPGPFSPAQDLRRMEETVRATFDRLGDSTLELAELRWHNDAAGFVPASKLNALRRELVHKLEAKLAEDRSRRLAQVHAAIAPAPAKFVGPLRWSLKVDRLSFLDDFAAEDFEGVDELILDITRPHPTELRERLEHLAGALGKDRIRLALPALTRAWEDKPLRQKIDRLLADGWTKWEAANLSAWPYLGLDPTTKSLGIDLATDWSVYVINRLAARQLIDMGVSRFALSPEDGFANARSLWQEFGARAVLIVYQDTPLFLAESCAYANLIGGCPGKANCSFESMEMQSESGEKVTALDYHCRTIVLNQGAFCLTPRLGELRQAGVESVRADFVYRPYAAAEVRERWRLLRAGRAIPHGHAANWSRGLL